MDSKVMELRLKQWIPIFEQQSKSGLNKQEWCKLNNINRTVFFKWQGILRKYLLEKNENMVQPHQSGKLVAQTTSKFVELAPVSFSERSSLNDNFVSSRDITSTAPISIKCGKFSIDLNNDANELLLSKVLKAMADVY